MSMDDLFARLAGNIAETAAQQQQDDNRSNDPVFFLDNKNRTYKLRLFTEQRGEGADAQLVLTREVHSHHGFDGVPRLPCSGRDTCPICAEVQRLRDAKYKDVWKFAARREALVKGYVYEANTPADYKYLKLNTHGYLVMRDKAYKGLNAFLKDLTPSELRSVLYEKEEAPRIKLILSPGSDGSASWGFDIKKAALPPIPSDMKSLDEVYITDKTPITDEHLRAIRKQINSILASMGSGEMYEPPEDDDSEAPSAPTRPNKEAARNAVSNAIGNTAAQPVSFMCPGASSGLEFGKNPQVAGGGINPVCLSCPKEDECILATPKA